MRIKLFENFSKGPELLNSFQDAESKLSDKDGIVLPGVTGDMTHIEDAIKDIPHNEAYVLITDQSSHVASSWKSDVFLVGGTKEGEMSIKQYFDEEWTDPAGGTHRGNEEDPAAAYEAEVKAKKVPLKDLLKSKSIEPGNFLSMKGWPKALVDGIDYAKKTISLQFKEDGPINDYKFDDESLEKGNIMTKLWEHVNEGTMISKRNMDLDAFKHQGSFFNREPHSNDSPVHGKSIKELNEERSGDLLMELTNVITRYKTKMKPEAIFDVLHLLAERQKNEF